MPRLLLMLIGFALSGAIKRMIVGAGLGLISMTFIISFFNWYIERFTHFGQSENIGGVFGLLAIAEIPKCVSIVMGAVVSRMTINAMTLSITRAK